jgi:hypothetical protein
MKFSKIKTTTIILATAVIAALAAYLFIKKVSDSLKIEERPVNWA